MNLKTNWSCWLNKNKTIFKDLRIYKMHTIRL